MPTGNDHFPQPAIHVLPPPPPPPPTPSQSTPAIRPRCVSAHIDFALLPASSTTTTISSTSFATTTPTSISTPASTPTSTTTDHFTLSSVASAAPKASGPVSPAASTVNPYQDSGNQSSDPRYLPASPPLTVDNSNKSKSPNRQWKTPDISRYGLTYSATTCENPFNVVSSTLLTPTSDPTSPTATSPPTQSRPRLLRPPSLQGKRHSDEETAQQFQTQSSPLKKPRTTRLAPPKSINLPKPPLPSAILASRNQQAVTSPLFFSRRQAHMPPRPNPLPPSDAAAVLLARLREDADGVHTVRLPRGTVHTQRSSARSGSTPGSSSLSSSAEATLTSSRSPNSQSIPPGLQILRGIGVVELLEQDERPTFIIDLANPVNTNNTDLHLLYANAALRASAGVLELLSVEGEDAPKNADYTHFKAWVMSFVRNHESMDVCLPSHGYGGITWTCSTLRKRFRFVSGNMSAVSTAPDSPGPLAEEAAVLEQRSRGPTPSQPSNVIENEPDYFGDLVSEPHESDDTPIGDDCVMVDDGGRHHTDEFTQQVFQAAMMRPSFDWTRIQVTDDLNEHILFCRNTDWASTPLGPIEHWSTDLRAMANMVMGSPHPAAMYWGPENTIIYNEAYVELAGQKHPQLMGMRYRDAWKEIWDDLEPVVSSAWNNGQSTMKNDNQLFILRHGFLEETFFSWSLIPLLGSDGQVMGIYNPAFENTRRKVNERRMLTLREVGEKTAAAKDVRSFWPRVKEGLEFNDVDVPFALIYSVKEDNESEVSSMHSGSIVHPPLLQLEGTLGVPVGHPTALSNLDLKSSDEGFAPWMRQSMTMAGAPIVLSAESGNLPSKLLEGFEWRGFGDPSKTIVILPVHPTTAGESVVGFIVLGTNPRRPYDDDYQLFIHLLSRQLATSMASVVLFEEEIKRGQRAARLAALDRQELQMELYLRTQEAVESEYKFTRMAEFAPVGIIIANDKGLINFANDMWWQISRHPRSEDSVNSWMKSVREEDRLGVERSWRKLVEEREAITIEFRFKCSRQNGVNTIDTWVLMSAFPEKTEEGDLKSIFACITDISPQKWAEDFQKQRREEAVELKRQQENFIDITSHEMRNPLSAVLQCADEIVNSISEFRSSHNDKELDVLLEGCTEAASTINLCASHQKRIVDDVLTLSKLDSQLLLVTPVDSHPVTVVRHVIKMFESELNTHDIRLEFSIEKAYLNHAVDWVRLDPSRLRQVLINLMTNAIKFTQGREKREITLRMSASKNLSEVTGKGVVFFPTRKEDVRALTHEKDWGDGEEINLHFSVQDTGPGLREDEKKLLFQRFSQASPRTHVQYGGSGLGLFISRMLAELQGGQIGVVSEKGIGSTFAFYVKCRKTETPSSESTTLSALNLARPAKTTVPSASSTPPPTTLPRRSSYRKQVSEGPPHYDVLIVEDNIVNQRVLQKQLRNWGNNTHVANHGGEALDQLRKSRFWSGNEADGFDLSVILMDLEMPVMDGMTCARRIRELEREGTIISHIPIIAVTAYARPEQIESAKAAGIDDVISKPFRIPDLIPKIEDSARTSIARLVAAPPPPAATRTFTSTTALSKKKNKAPSYPTNDSPAVVSKTSHSAPAEHDAADPDDVPGSKHPKPDPSDPLNFADVASRFQSLATFHTDILKKIQAGDRFSPDAIGALAVQPDKKSGATFPLRELAEIVPRPGGRTVSLLLHERDYVKPVMAAVQASADFNQQPQRNPDNELELVLKVESQGKDVVARKAKDAAQMWRDKMRAVTEKRKKVHAKWQKDAAIVPDLKRRADKELQKLQDKEMKDVDAVEQQTIRKIQ
ncbi:Hybrid signal transduction histidine kinase K [Colletotrichum spinosum]|uniref:Hybrid signal transduction histidine kinase K n=1 Tax=Colletotrichum spinosum TaxID=1347390 RepID=A0A4R8Q6E8_9PEZI|nr:Hybrid signal transduction histidine kinase K [Colletotrichum spinosum]